jgi:sugar phosphate isomerase/epimerase
MMRIGVRAHDFGKLPVDELASRIAAKGVSTVQLALNKAIEGMDLKPGDLSPGLASSIGQAFSRHGIHIAVLGCYVNPIHPEPDTRAALLRYFKDHIRFARDFGCGLVALETGSLNADYSFHPDNHGPTAFASFIENIRVLVEEARRFGVIVGIEGVATHVISTPHKMRKALDEVGSGNLQVVFDPVNFLSIDNYRDQDRVIADAFDLFGDRMVAVHAKDFLVKDGTLRTVPAGRGCLNYGLLLGTLKKRKPGVHILLENAGESAVGECIRFMNGVSGP